MDSIDVLYTIDDKYTDIMMASMLSVILNSGMKKINFHLVLENLHLDIVKKVEDVFITYPNVDINWYSLKDIHIEKYNIPTWRGSHIANARLFLTEILKENLSSLKYILYLDADTLTLGSLDELVGYKDLEIGAVKDFWLKRDLGNFSSGNYFNSGVLLIDVDKWQENDYTNEILKFYRDSSHELLFPDQDLLNYVLGSKITELPLKYNMSPYMFIYKDILGPLFFNGEMRITSYEEVKEAINDIHIIHSMGFMGIKPWSKNIVNPFNKYYMEYILDVNPTFTKEQYKSICNFMAYNPLLMYMLPLLKMYLPKNISSGMTNLSLKLQQAIKK